MSSTNHRIKMRNENFKNERVPINLDHPCFGVWKLLLHFFSCCTLDMSYRLLVKNAKQLVMITKNHEKMLCGKAMNDIVVLNDAYALRLGVID